MHFLSFYDRNKYIWGFEPGKPPPICTNASTYWVALDCLLVSILVCRTRGWGLKSRQGINLVRDICLICALTQIH